jgi:hypothetical protein
MQASDMLHLEKLLHDDLTRNSPHQIALKDAFMKKARKGRELLIAYLGGDRKLSDISGQGALTDLILDVLRFQQSVNIWKQVFTEWHDELLELNQGFSEKMYLDVAGFVQSDSDITSSEEFQDFLCELYITKAGGDLDKTFKIRDVCLNVVGKEMLEAGMIKSLRR